MSIDVKPWKGRARKFQVYIHFRWTDGSPYTERKVIDAPTHGQALKWGEQRERELREAGRPKPEEVKAVVATVAEFAPDWIEKYARANLHKESGIDGKEMVLRIHLLPFIGTIPLGQVTDEVVANPKAKWIKGGYTYVGQGGAERTVRPTSASSTINNRLTVLSSLLNIAYDWKRIPALPCRIKLLKRDTGKEAGFYEHGQYERLVEAAEKMDPRYHALMLLAGDGGLRRGEVIGLDLADVDFISGHMNVQRSVFFKKKKRHVGAPKGGKAKKIPVTPRLLAALKKVKHLRGPKVLYTDAGEEVTPGTVEPWVRAIEKRAGLPVTGRLHVLRHTFCSHAAMAGVPAMTI